MIKIKQLKFENILSYGTGNVIDFTKEVTQLVGVNGAGKSSIPTILEEALYNKNSRGIKKADLFNRFIPDKKYFIAVSFDVGNDSYILEKTVTSTTKLVLKKNGEDVSGHTATQTYKFIEDLMGVDFQTFSKLVYQSMVSSLDFLSATDANRKKFLVSLLGLEKYLEIESKVKEFTKEKKLLLSAAKSKVDTINSFIEANKEYANKPLLDKPIKNDDLDKLIDELETKGMELSNQYSSVNLRNSVIEKNITAKRKLNNLVPVSPADYVEPIGTDKVVRQQKVGREITIIKNDLSKLSKVKDTCHACGQPVDIKDTLKRIEELNSELIPLQEEYDISSKLMEENRTAIDKYTKFKTYEEKLKELQAEYSEEIGTTLLDGKDLKIEFDKVMSEISKLKKEAKDYTEECSRVALQNERIKTKIEQLEEYSQKLVVAKAELETIQILCDRLDLLVSALGAKGLVSYKIESIVKEFENLINYYLQELSDGRFVLEFAMEDNKLQMNLYSRSVLVDIKSLSSGEFNRVNTATLLAIRNMLSSVSKVNIDLLFLDEVVSVLDTDGKDTLIDLLLKETNLNSVLVSHGYTHPLTRKIKVIKNKDISELVHE